MFHYYCRVSIFFVMVFLFTTSLGYCAKLVDQSVLIGSKIKEKSFKKVFRDIKKTLPKELRKCQIEVIDIKLLKDEDRGVGENWTVEVCQYIKKEYLVTTIHPKGYYCTVISKEEALSQDKRYWEAAKKFGTEEVWRDTIMYIDEIEKK